MISIKNFKNNMSLYLDIFGLDTMNANIKNPGQKISLNQMEVTKR